LRDDTKPEAELSFTVLTRDEDTALSEILALGMTVNATLTPDKRRRPLAAEMEVIATPLESDKPTFCATVAVKTCCISAPKSATVTPFKDMVAAIHGTGT
jgi:hypothetical protein